VVTDFATPSGNYAIVGETTPDTYTLTATPQGGQADDKCGILSVDESNTRHERHGQPVVVANKCW
jgi:Tfp pilus assembly protein PilE